MPGYWLTLNLFTCKFLHILTHTLTLTLCKSVEGNVRQQRRSPTWPPEITLRIVMKRKHQPFHMCKDWRWWKLSFLLAIKKENTKTVPAAIFCRVSVEIVNRAEQMAWVVKGGIYLHFRRIVYLLWSNQPGLKEFRDDSRMSSTLLVFGQLIPYSYSSLERNIAQFL